MKGKLNDFEIESVNLFVNHCRLKNINRPSILNNIFIGRCGEIAFKKELLKRNIFFLYDDFNIDNADFYDFLIKDKNNKNLKIDIKTIDSNNKNLIVNKDTQSKRPKDIFVLVQYIDKEYTIIGWQHKNSLNNTIKFGNSECYLIQRNNLLDINLLINFLNEK
jgi:hypothetical protein